MSWRLAKSLEILRAQVDTAYPGRSKLSDGTIGDPRHQTTSSDHNPHCSAPGDPTVTALDLTHDPGKGADMNVLAEALRESKDPRIKYIIWNGRIMSSSLQPWTWRAYSGSNPHTKHIHISVQCNASKDSTRKWQIAPEQEDWFSMATEAELRKVIREEVKKEMDRQRRLLAVGSSQKSYKPDNVNLKAILKK